MIRITTHLPLLLVFFAGLFTVSCSSTRVSGSMDRESRLRSEIVDFARQQVGARYKSAGRDPRTGFDCSGFTYYVLDHFKVKVTPVSRLQAKEGRKVKLSDVRPGDLIYYRRNPGGRVFHVSMVVSNDRNGITVVHSVSRGVAVENISQSSYWKPKIAGARNVISP